MRKKELKMRKKDVKMKKKDFKTMTKPLINQKIQIKLIVNRHEEIIFLLDMKVEKSLSNCLNDEIVDMHE